MSQTLSLTVNKQLKGPNLKLSFFITSLNNYSDNKSEHFVIADLATVAFRFKLTSENKCHIYMSFVKHDVTETSTIRLNVTCDELNYSKQFICSHNSPDWIPLGTQDAIQLRNNNLSVTVRTYVVNISIRACKEGSETYRKLYEDTEFTDFQLTAADGSVTFHKSCLAVRSDYFKRMLAGKWKEVEEGSVELKDVTKKNLQDLKDFIYLGTLPDDGLLPLIVLAKRFLIEDLVAACAKKLAETVLPCNLYSLQEHACLNNIPELTCAITEITPDTVVDGAYQLKIKNDTALKNGAKKRKLNE